METRNAVDSDLQQVAELFDRYRQFYEQAADLEQVRAFIGERFARKDSTIIVAVGRAEIVGFTQLYPSYSSVAMRRTYILNDLYVDAEHRMSGAGTSLIKAAAKYASQQGALRLTLATAVTNRSAQKLYESLGWVRDEKFLHYNLALPA